MISTSVYKVGEICTMKKIFNAKRIMLTLMMAIIVAVFCSTSAVALASGKPDFDTTSIGFESKTVVYDGNQHYIEPTNLPAGALVKFNTYVSEPGVYDATAIIYVGDKYAEKEVTLHATLTILATELKSGKDGSFFIEEGVDPSVGFKITEGGKELFSGISKEDSVYASYSVALTKDGSAYTIKDGSYKMSVRLPIGKGYSGLKIYVKDASGVKEAQYALSGEYATITVDDSVTNFAVTYSGKVKLYGAAEADLTWLVVLLGVLSVGELVVVVLQVVKLKKLK